jgi:hypothetical protein
MGNGDPSHDGIFWNEKAAQARQANLMNQDRITWAQADAISSQNYRLKNRILDQKAELKKLQRQLSGLEANPNPAISSKAAELQKICAEAITTETDPKKIDQIIASIQSETAGLQRSSNTP